jgi:hypothetical protein
MIVQPRSEWAYLWIAWYEELEKADNFSAVGNKKTKVDVLLGDKEIISKVRLNAEEKLKLPIDLNN